MTPPLEQRLAGRGFRRRRLAAWSLAALGLFVATLAAYAVGMFHIAGGVIVIPGQAALLAVAAAGVVGYTRSGPVPAWLVAAGPLLGYRADHAFFGLSGRPRSEQLSYFLELEGLGVVALQGVVLAIVGFTIGSLVRLGVGLLTREPSNRAGGR